MTTNTHDAFRVLERAIDLLGDTPQPLLQAARDAARYVKARPDALSEGNLVEALRSSDLNDPIQLALGRAVSRWDYVASADWVGGTERNTPDRRDLICRLLGFSNSLAKLCSGRFPPVVIDGPIVISDDHKDWYPDLSLNQFYWNEYTKYLQIVGWPQDSINVLDDSTTSVVERLSCPWIPDAYQSKGLVVGYVQSGKTANFTGVIAKAVDAGYRLIVVLAGLLDVLRNQTQRRLDRELIGKELLAIAPGGNEYGSDQDWQSFVEHGALPSTFGAVDWHRLTGPDHDYLKLGKGVDSLDFESRDRRLAANARENLSMTRARLLVVKKNPRILERVIADLGSLRRTALESVPALIIDDESDQASIDTSRPAPEELKLRSATNKAIRKLLEILPRAQYVGYTATPFANVLVDPKDKHDIFPRDFIVSLPRPSGYMGITEFFDMVDVGPAATFATSNESAFVRSVVGPSDRPENLQAAIESFLLAGALKLYRQAKEDSLSGAFRHHTMLVHSSARKRAHASDARFVEGQYGAVVDDLEQMWRRLEERFVADFRPVSACRGKGLPFPGKFESLQPYVTDCRNLLEERQLIRIVNGDNRDDAPDFDKNRIWSILVGGTKLSRGYTIEGLTVSYYRRTSTTADTLMQMGRWFGFRKGYGDLVRLYLGRSEPLDKKGKRTLDLLEAFKATCLDEEEFRTEIKRYASVKGEGRIRPLDVPPLVPSHMLRPTAANKMQYAKLKMMNFGGRWSEKTLAPVEKAAMRSNLNAATELVEGATPAVVTLRAVIDNKACRFDAAVGRAMPPAVLRFLKEYRWADNTFNVVQREIDFLAKRSPGADPGIDSWLIIAPQLQSGPGQDGNWVVAGLNLTVKQRARVNEVGRFKAFSEPDHRNVAAFLCGVESGASTDPTTLRFKKERQGALLLYPVRDKKGSDTSIGFAMVFPPNTITSQLRWAVDSSGDRAESDP